MLHARKCLICNNWQNVGTIDSSIFQYGLLDSFTKTSISPERLSRFSSRRSWFLTVFCVEILIYLNIENGYLFKKGSCTFPELLKNYQIFLKYHPESSVCEYIRIIITDRQCDEQTHKHNMKITQELLKSRFKWE